MQNLGLNIYLLFVISWFLHLPARLPFLGVVRFDLLLVSVLGALALSRFAAGRYLKTPIDKWLTILIAYSVLTIPFVEWPGSVVKFGLPDFIKAVVFYYFTVAFITSEQDLKKLLLVFLGCQLFRILEPLYLHVTEGYWGSSASELGGREFLNRLAGSPYDVVNPNGLGWVILTALPLLYFMRGLSWKHRIAFVSLSPLCLYALVLTGSRSSVIGLGAVLLVFMLRSRRRVALIFFSSVAIAIGFSYLSPDMQDRYLSIVGQGEKNANTASDRLIGLEEYVRVALRRPVFGYGLGTSAEANVNFAKSGPYAGRALPAHNLYVEVMQEVGVAGLLLYLLFLRAILTCYSECRQSFKRQDAAPFLQKVFSLMQIWLILNIVISFASYGLSTPDWYLLAGLFVVLRRLATVGYCELDGRSRPASVATV